MTVATLWLTGLLLSGVGPVTPNAHANPEPSEAVVDDACVGALDAVVTDGTVACRSPGALDADDVIATTGKSDEIVPPAPLSRDPAIFPGELGFVSVVIGAVGVGGIAGAYTLSATPWEGRDPVPPTLLWGGISAVGLAGLVAGAALSTFVFDPTSGALRLPIFEGEP